MPFFFRLIRSSTALLVVLALIAVNVASYFLHARIDLTAGGQYTLAPATKTIVRSLATPIIVKAFVSKELPPQVVSERQQLTDTLSEYAAINGSKLSVDYVDPASDTKAKSLAEALGIPELQLQVIERDQQSVMKAYFGLAILREKPKSSAANEGGNPLDAYAKYEAIPVVQDFAKLEYDLTAAIKKVSSDDTKVIGFLSGHGEHELRPGQMASQFEQMMYQQNPRADYPLIELLNKNYTTQSVTVTDEKPTIEGVNTLVVAGPTSSLPEKTIAAIHTFVAKGGNAIFLIDRVTSPEATMTASATPDDFAPLLAPWGIAITPAILADSSHDNAMFSQGFMSFSLPYPPWVRSRDLAVDSPITSGIAEVTLPWISPLSITKKSDVTVTPLVRSSSHYALLTEKDVPAKEGEQPTKQPINLNPQQDFAIGADVKEPLPLVVEAQKKGEGKILVVGDSDFLAGNMAEQMGAARTLFLNAVDALTLGDELISIRAKATTDRPLDPIADIAKDIIRWGNILGMSLVVIAYGLIRRWIRAMKKEATFAG